MKLTALFNTQEIANWISKNQPHREVKTSKQEHFSLTIKNWKL